MVINYINNLNHGAMIIIYNDARTMKYKVIIHKGRPFQGTIDLNRKQIKTVKRPHTAEVIYLNADGSVKESVKYGVVFIDEIKQYIQNNENIDLDGCYVSNLDISDFEIKSISARSTFFDNKTVFHRVTFSGAASFDDSVFGGGASFNKATFSDDVSFISTIFSKYTSFDRTTFSKVTLFGSTTFSEYTSFKLTTFCGHISFGSTTFSDYTSFEITTFGDAFFDNSTFCRDVFFNGSTFNRKASFSDTRFCGDTSFLSSTFGDTSFDRVTFDGNASFLSTAFSGGTSFSSTTFGGTSFHGITFNEYTNFRDIIVNGSISFDYVKFLSGVLFLFRKCSSFILENCNVEKSYEFGTQVRFNEFCITNCKNFGQIFIDFDQNNLKKAIYTYSKRNHLFAYDIANEFNLLKVNFNKTGRYDDEGKAYVEYKRCLRRSLPHMFLPSDEKKSLFAKIWNITLKIFHNIRAFFNWLLLDVISCYCTKPFRVLLSAMIAIIFFGLMYYATGTVKFGINYEAFAGCIYHSVITFFTIGYGDSNPSGTRGLLLTGFEGFIGVFLMSLFTVSFVRKALR